MCKPGALVFYIYGLRRLTGRVFHALLVRIVASERRCGEIRVRAVLLSGSVWSLYQHCFLPLLLFHNCILLTEGAAFNKLMD